MKHNTQTDSTVEANETLHQLARDSHYKSAGELFGRLQSALGFGELTMAESKHINSAACCIAYRWSFQAGGKTYGCEEQLHIHDWRYIKSIPEHAAKIAERWKQLHRNSVALRSLAASGDKT